MKSSLFQQPLALLSRSAQNGFNKEEVFEFDVPVPPLAEQKRIVVRLEELQSRTRAAREALADVPKLLEQYRQSVLAAAFRGDLTAEWREKNPNIEPASVLLDRIRAERRKQWEAKFPKKKYVEPQPVDDSDLPELPEGWCWTTAEEIVDPSADIVYGIVQPGKHLQTGVPYVRGCDIQNGKILEKQLLKTSQEIADKYERASLKGGDVLLGIIRATKVAIVPDSLNGANITQGTARFRPSFVITTGFLSGWLDTPFAQNWLHEHYRGIDMPGLNLRDVRLVPVPIAPLKEQKTVALLLEKYFHIISGLKNDFFNFINEFDQFDQSLLAMAFRGELVPQDPADEPASALLSRLQSGNKIKTRQPITSAKLSRFVLMLLHHWKGAASREIVDRGVLLMMDDDLRQRLLANGATPRPKKRGRKAAVPVITLPNLLGKMLDAGFIRVSKRSDSQTIHVADIAKAKKGYDTAEAADLERLQQAIKLMDEIDERILASEINESFHGQTIEELVSC